jgi:hypothetical protein
MRSEKGNGVDGCCFAGTAEWFRRLFGLHFDAFSLLQKSSWRSCWLARLKSCLRALDRAIWMAVWRRFGWLAAG